MLLTTENTSQISAVLGSSNLALGCNRHLGVRSFKGQRGHLKNFNKLRGALKGSKHTYTYVLARSSFWKLCNLTKSIFFYTSFKKKIMCTPICGKNPISHRSSDKFIVNYFLSYITRKV